MKKNGSAKLGAWVALLVGGMALGLYGVVEVLTKGQGETLGTSDQVPWGIFVVGYAFFIGISAGATFIGVMIHAFGRADYRPLGIPALLVAILSLVAGTLLITLDVGNPAKMILVPWVLRNPSSVFLYTSLSYYLLGAILVGELYFTVKLARGSSSGLDRRMAKWLAIAAAPAAFWLQGTLFGVVKAREYWNTPLLPPHSMVAALVSGTAVVILVSMISSLVSSKPFVGMRTLDQLGKLMLLFAAVALLFDVVDMFIANYSETAEGAETWALLTGKYLGLYALNLGGLGLVFLILLRRRGRATAGLLTASLISVLAVAAYRYNLVVVGQVVPLWPDQVGPVAEYSPSSVEWSLTIGVLALALMAYTVLVRILAVEEPGLEKSKALSAAQSPA